MHDQIINEGIVPKEMLKKVVDNLEYNKVILNYYERFKHEAGVVFSRRDIENRRDRMDFCNKYWLMEVFNHHKEKWFFKTSLCKDKFCSNCKKVKQAVRSARYMDDLKQYSDNLYHLTLTLPNCSGADLRPTYNIMAKAFRRLIKIIRSEYVIKGLDLSSWGYLGAVRSLEVTFKGDNYHPHFHVALVMNDVLGKRNIENKYSWDYSKGIPELTRLFSEQEILIQKIWYLLVNGIKVTKQTIDELEIGYSCTIDKFSEGDYAELFKYMTKECDENGKVLTYGNFVALIHGLYNVKQIQGYGCLYQIKDNDEGLEDNEKIFNECYQDRRAKENPSLVSEKPRDLLSDSEYKIISRKTIFKYLKTIM